ncbi:DUF5060 domain-containing protein [Opitutia bacterium ISCC 51]|nr:DUF5060 domain-containing protein [Opitutae bacterium ISCC 51]QXD26600.1 DUF5060 domain-containing protein [Opitutae bacterium ISCC 52]
MTKIRILLLTVFALLSVHASFADTIHGDLVTWHKATIDFEGPNSSETGDINPFTDYRLDVEFTGPSGQRFSIPGYFAADGNAGESSAESGNIWRVHFCPDESGSWKYQASFVKGKMVAANLKGGKSAGYFDDTRGTFEVSDSDKAPGKDFRTQGRLAYVGKHFLQFQRSKAYFLKAGANSPEVFLEYKGFDNTPSKRTYPDHIQDWNQDDPTWKNGKGKGIIGVINYLSSLGVNALYFLPMNSYGDGKQAWPWIDGDAILTYDCSKLDQWEVLFSHMTHKGVMPHFVLSETENEAFFEIRETGRTGGFAKSRKVYYREMVARFGHHPAITWNIGEENGWAQGDGYHTANTDEQRILFSAHLRKLVPYDDHIVIHNGPSYEDWIFTPLLGNKNLTGPAFQWNYEEDIYGKTLEWRNKSAAAGQPWVFGLDEPFIKETKVPMEVWRKNVVWGTFMAGSAGVELYIGKGDDLRVQDYRPFEKHYQTAVRAIRFLSDHTTFKALEPHEDFADNAWTLSKEGETYLLYLADGGTTEVKLPEGEYSAHWFDPRNGGDLQRSSKKSLSGGNSTSIGNPPNSSDDDWVCLIRKN